MPQVGETKRIGASIFMWDGTRWIARKVNAALQGRTTPAASPVATVARPQAATATAKKPTRAKPKQTDEEWFNDVPAAEGGKTARRRNRFIYDKKASAGVKQGFVSPRMREARAAFAFDAGQALSTGGTRNKAGMGIGPVESSGTKIKARRQAEAEAELQAARNRAGVGPQQAAQTDAAKAKWEEEQRRQGENRAFGRDVAMERFRQEGRAGEQAGRQDFEAWKLGAEQEFKAGQTQAGQQAGLEQNVYGTAWAGLKAGTHELSQQQQNQLRNLDDATQRILADETLDAGDRQAALGEVTRQRGAIMPTAKLDTGTVKAADVVKDAVTYDKDGNAFILQPDGKIDFHAKKPDAQDKPVVDFQTFNETIAGITEELTKTEKVSTGKDPKTGKETFEDKTTMPTSDQVMKTFKERMDVWKQYQEELTGKPKTEQAPVQPTPPTSTGPTQTSRFFDFATPVGMRSKSEQPSPYAPLREPPGQGGQPPAAQPPATPPPSPPTGKQPGTMNDNDLAVYLRANPRDAAAVAEARRRLGK